ncbi:MAG TPA: radical SAM protein [Bacteroidales bacterium]|nr:radical SAM protein [Bacteroidales bacterium]
MAILKSFRSILNGLFKKQKNPACFAPFNNMTIEKSGKVTVCCYNRSLVLGKYPDESLNNIWFGNTRKLLIEQFLIDRAPSSCYHCLTNCLSTDSPESKIFCSRAWNLSRFSDYPVQIEFILDNICNLDCIMCSQFCSTSSTNEVALDVEKVDYDHRFLKELEPFLKSGNFFVFSGGEPFLIPVYKEIWKYIHKENPKAKIYVQTNGTILTEEIKHIIETYKMEISVSIDSVEKNTYEQIRRNASFEKTFHNLEYFLNYAETYKKTITLRITPSKINAYEIPEVLTYCNSKNMLLGLGIIESPCYLAIWSLPSSELEIIINNYRFIYIDDKTDNPVIRRNNIIFSSYVNLVNKYYDKKKYNEQNKEIILSNMIKAREDIEKNFITNLSHNIQEIDCSTDLKKKFLDDVDVFINENYKKYSGLFDDNRLFYSYFFSFNETTDLRPFLFNGLNITDAIVAERMKELAYLFSTNTFDRITNVKNYDCKTCAET